VQVTGQVVKIAKHQFCGTPTDLYDLLCCPAEPEVVPVLEELPKWGLLTEVMQVCYPCACQSRSVARNMQEMQRLGLCLRWTALVSALDTL
jgi:hypothetical protein